MPQRLNNPYGIGGGNVILPPEAYPNRNSGSYPTSTLSQGSGEPDFNSLPPAAWGVRPGAAYPNWGTPIPASGDVYSGSGGFDPTLIPRPSAPSNPDWIYPDFSNAPPVLASSPDNTDTLYPDLSTAPPVMVDQPGTDPNWAQNAASNPRSRTSQIPADLLAQIFGQGYNGPYGGSNSFGQGIGDFGVDSRGNYGQQAWNQGAYSQAMLGLGIDPGAMMYRGHLQS